MSAAVTIPKIVGSAVLSGFGATVVVAVAGLTVSPEEWAVTEMESPGARFKPETVHFPSVLLPLPEYLLFHRRIGL